MSGQFPIGSMVRITVQRRRELCRYQATVPDASNARRLLETSHGVVLNNERGIMVKWDNGMQWCHFIPNQLELVDL